MNRNVGRARTAKRVAARSSPTGDDCPSSNRIPTRLRRRGERRFFLMRDLNVCGIPIRASRVDEVVPRSLPRGGRGGFWSRRDGSLSCRRRWNRSLRHRLTFGRDPLMLAGLALVLALTTHPTWTARLDAHTSSPIEQYDSATASAGSDLLLLASFSSRLATTTGATLFLCRCRRAPSAPSVHFGSGFGGPDRTCLS